MSLRTVSRGFLTSFAIDEYLKIGLEFRSLLSHPKRKRIKYDMSYGSSVMQKEGRVIGSGLDPIISLLNF
jgi:hypothetical protein